MRNLPHLMPNQLAAHVCSSPGSFIRFVGQYFGGEVPSEFAQLALTYACNNLVGYVNYRINRYGTFALAILAPGVE